MSPSIPAWCSTIRLITAKGEVRQTLCSFEGEIFGQLNIDASDCKKFVIRSIRAERLLGDEGFRQDCLDNHLVTIDDPARKIIYIFQGIREVYFSGIESGASIVVEYPDETYLKKTSSSLQMRERTVVFLEEGPYSEYLTHLLEARNYELQAIDFATFMYM